MNFFPDIRYSKTIQTPIGNLIAIADHQRLLKLSFSSARNYNNHISSSTVNSPISGNNTILEQIAQEIEQYFAGAMRTFTTPCALQGTPFQQHVWQAVQNIPYGTTASYSDLAHMIGQSKAHRAVAHAVASNTWAIIIPCHRIIHKTGTISEYNAGKERKQWLLLHEAYSIASVPSFLQE